MQNNMTIYDLLQKTPKRIQNTPVRQGFLFVMLVIAGFFLLTSCVLLFLPGQTDRAVAWTTFSLVIVGVPAILYGYKNLLAVKEGNEELKRQHDNENDFRYMSEAAKLFAISGHYETGERGEKISFSNRSDFPFYDVIPFYLDKWEDEIKVIPFAWQPRNPKQHKEKPPVGTLDNVQLEILTKNDTPREIAVWKVIPPKVKIVVLTNSDEELALHNGLGKVISGEAHTASGSIKNNMDALPGSRLIALLYKDVYHNAWWIHPGSRPKKVNYDELLETLVGKDVKLMSYWRMGELDL